MFRTCAPRTGAIPRSGLADGLVPARAGAKTTLAATFCLLLSLLAAPPVQGQTESVPDLIHKYAAVYGANPVQLTRIAWCESRFLPSAFNAKDGTRGVFQWQRASWEEVAPQIGLSPDFAGAWDAPTNVAVSAYAWALGQAWRWRGCW